MLIPNTGLKPLRIEGEGELRDTFIGVNPEYGTETKVLKWLGKAGYAFIGVNPEYGTET